LGDTQQARASYSRALSLLEEPTPELFLERTALPATVEVRLAELEEAMARVGAAHVLMLRALELEIAAGRTDDALRRINQLAAQSERKETWWKRKGDLLAASGRSHEARLAYSQARAAIAALPGWLQKSPALLGLLDDLQRDQDKLPTVPSP
jgi:predicted negative regulator of RcsB-dependent stress response